MQWSSTVDAVEQRREQRSPTHGLPDRGPFARLSADEQSRLVAATRTERFDVGAPIALAGSYPRRFWIIGEGHVKVHRRLRDGTEVIADVRGPGALIGEAAVLSGEAIGVDVTTLDQVRTLTVGAGRLESMLRNSQAIATALHRAVARAALRSEAIVIRNGRPDPMDRVVLALLDLEARFGVDVPAGRSIGVPLSQRELASWAGMCRESFAKVLRRLRSAGLVVTSRCEVVLPDPEALRASAFPAAPLPLLRPA